MLRRLQVRGFKSLADVELHLGRLVVIFGPNAVGKSNLLEAITLLSRLVVERTLSDAFAPPLRGYPLEAFSLPTGGMPELLGRDEVSLSLEAEVEPGAKKPSLRYRVGVVARPRSGEMSVNDELLARQNKRGEDEKYPRIERVEDKLLVRRRDKQGHPVEEPLGLHHTVASNTRFSGARYPDFDDLRNELAGWRHYYLDPAVAMRQPQPPREVSDIGSSGEYLAPYLFRLKGRRDQRFQSVRRALQAAIPTIEQLDVELDRERGTLDLQIQQQQRLYSSRVLSEGTLRILSLCAISANPWPESLVAFEEPENGVHPARIGLIADLLWRLSSSPGRQVVVTTHSPTFLSEMFRRGREQPDVLRVVRCLERGGVTELAPFDDPGPLLQDLEVREALASKDDATLLLTLMERNWL